VLLKYLPKTALVCNSAVKTAVFTLHYWKFALPNRGLTVHNRDYAPHN
jgi:hypothetical protein